MEYLQLTMDEFLQEEQGIKEELGSMAKSFVRTGWRLSRIDRSGAYKLKGYKSIAEYAKATFGMTSDGVSRFIDVYEKYSIPGDTPELKEQYQDFNFSQLKEMLTLPEEDEVMIRPETKREDIRELKRFNKESENNPNNLLNWQQETERNLKKAILEFFRNRKDSLNALYGSEAYQQNDIKAMSRIIYHGQPKSFRDSNTTIFMILYENEIFTKGFNRDPEDITWEKFFEVTREIFDGAAAGDHTWENYFEPEEPQEEPSEEPEIAPAQKEPEEDGQIPGQENIMNRPEYMPEASEIQIEEQYKALYESLTPATLAPLHNGETGFLAAMIYKNFGNSSVKSEKLNYRATDDGMIFNPDTTKTLVGWTALAEELIKTFGKKKPVKMASVVETEEATDPEEKWTEAEAVKLYAEEYPKELKEIMKICRGFSNNGDRAKAVHKHYGRSGGGDWDFGRYFGSFGEGVTIESSAKNQKVKMKYGRFVVELLNLYDPFSPEFAEEEIAPAQQKTEIIQNTCTHRPDYTCTLNKAQQAAAGDGENCNEKCCWNCKNHGTCGYECNSSAHRPEFKEDAAETQQKEETEEGQQDEIPEWWPEDLADIPVPSLAEITRILYDAERDLKDYLSCEGIPEMTILKKQLIAGGLRLIKRLVKDMQEED